MTDDLNPIEAIQQLGAIPDRDPAHDPNAIVLGSDGDPLTHPTATRMIEKESYERVIEGLKMAADACMHLAKQEPQDCEQWKRIGQKLDQMRLSACKLGGMDLTMKQLETQGARGNPYAWKRARERLLNGVKQASGGMRQLAVCFRSDFQWSIMAQTLDRSEKKLRALVVGKTAVPSMSQLILPPGYTRH
jgi:hypothetical protein